MEKVLHYIEEGKDRFLRELIEFLEIPSVSSVSDNDKDTARCADWVAANFKNIGMQNVEVIPTPGHPVVYADWLNAGADKPTLLIYGHYDVQPIDPIEKWDFDPFKPIIKDGKIWGRGTADDKGQVFTHIKAIEALLAINKELPCNVKFIIEGEEECGSSNLDTFIMNNAEKLKCDYVIVSDTEWFADGLPTICYGLRGICYTEVTVTGPNRDLHSGSFGGAVENPINVLSWMISQLTDKYGRITIPGIYDDVVELTQIERDAFAALPYNEKKYKADLGVELINGEAGFTTLERTWARPSLDVNGIWGGYIKEGAKTVIPSTASAKISMRLVPHQNSKEVADKLENYLKAIAPKSVKVDFKYLHGGEPVLVEMDSHPVKACAKAFEKAFGVAPVYMREGGSIAIVALFGSVLKAPTVLMGLGLPGDNIHSPNENYSIDNFYGGIKTSVYFLNEIVNKQ